MNHKEIFLWFLSAVINKNSPGQITEVIKQWRIEELDWVCLESSKAIDSMINKAVSKSKEEKKLYSLNLKSLRDTFDSYGSRRSL